MKKILFVCLGNICRSPLAEALFTSHVDAAGMSDKFYHWGALLGYIGIIEEGYVPSPQQQLHDN